MRRSRVAIVTSLVSVLALVVSVCPCPMALGQVQSQPARAHGCCTSQAVIRGSAPHCCDAAAVQVPALAAAQVSVIAISAAAIPVVLVPVVLRNDSSTDWTRTAAISRVLRI